MRNSLFKARHLLLASWKLEVSGLLLVLLVATAFRLGLALRPPPFITPDSQGYFLPGWELANGYGFSPELRRTPGYPLFIALVMFLLGDDLRGLVLAQHTLGVATAGLTYVLGRSAFGALAGLVAGLAVAVAGPLLVYEHYVMTESLFAFCLVLATLLGLKALQRPTGSRLLAAGAALGAAAQIRPVADVLLPLLPVLLLLSTRSLHVTIRGSTWFGLGLALLFLPWMARNALTHGTFSSEGALGQALIGRTVRHDDHDRFYDCRAPGEGEKGRARRIICEEAATGEPSGGVVTQRVREELGLTQAQTSNLLRQVAMEAIAQQPAYYLTGSLQKAIEILSGKRETVRAAWRERTTRNWDNKWDPRLTALVQDAPPAEGREYERADAIVSFFQPWRWRRPIGLLLGLGVAAALVVPAWRPALLPPLSAGAIVLASAALDGNVWRYRYPVDPLLAVTAAGGAQALLEAGRFVWMLVPGKRRRSVGLQPGRSAALGGTHAAPERGAGP